MRTSKPNPAVPRFQKVPGMKEGIAHAGTAREGKIVEWVWDRSARQGPGWDVLRKKEVLESFLCSVCRSVD